MKTAFQLIVGAVACIALTCTSMVDASAIQFQQQQQQQQKPPSQGTPAPTDFNQRPTLTPSTPCPITSKPDTPAPTTPAPTTSVPKTPTPTTSAPPSPAPTTPAPTTPAPKTPAPTTPSLTTPAPTTPAPKTPAPTIPAPTPLVPGPWDINLPYDKPGQCNGDIKVSIAKFEHVNCKEYFVFYASYPSDSWFACTRCPGTYVLSPPDAPFPLCVNKPLCPRFSSFGSISQKQMRCAVSTNGTAGLETTCGIF